MRPLKLVMSKNENQTWDQSIIDLFTDEIIFEYNGIPLEYETEEYFNHVEKRLRHTYGTIVEVERFI